MRRRPITDIPVAPDASGAELGAAVEENLFALFCAMAIVLPDAQIMETDTVSRHLTFPHNPMFKTE